MDCVCVMYKEDKLFLYIIIKIIINIFYVLIEVFYGKYLELEVFSFSFSLSLLSFNGYIPIFILLQWC